MVSFYPGCSKHLKACKHTQFACETTVALTGIKHKTRVILWAWSGFPEASHEFRCCDLAEHSILALWDLQTIKSPWGYRCRRTKTTLRRCFLTCLCFEASFLSLCPNLNFRSEPAHTGWGNFDDERNLTPTHCFKSLLSNENKIRKSNHLEKTYEKIQVVVRDSRRSWSVRKNQTWAM